MCVVVGDVHAFVAHSVTDGYCGEAHLDQQGNVAVSEIVDSDALDHGCFGCSAHFPVQTVLCDGEDPVGRLYSMACATSSTLR